MSTGIFPWLNDIPAFFQLYLEGWFDPESDGNCGFRAIAEACYGGQHNWANVRRAMAMEIEANREQYRRAYAYDLGPQEAAFRIGGHCLGPCGQPHWLDTPSDLFAAATVLNRAFILLSPDRGLNKTDNSAFILPLRAWSGVNGVENSPIGIAFVNSNHPLQSQHISPYTPRSQVENNQEAL